MISTVRNPVSRYKITIYRKNEKIKQIQRNARIKQMRAHKRRKQILLPGLQMFEGFAFTDSDI